MVNLPINTQEWEGLSELIDNVKSKKKVGMSNIYDVGDFPFIPDLSNCLLEWVTKNKEAGIEDLQKKLAFND